MSDVEHGCAHPLAICRSSRDKCLFLSSAHSGLGFWVLRVLSLLWECMFSAGLGILTRGAYAAGT